MNRLRVAAAVVNVFFVAGCAHAPAPAPAPGPAPVAQAPAAKPQLEASPSPGSDADPSAQLANALRGTAIFFEFNRDQLEPGGMQALQRAADVLRKSPKLVIKVEGNCDERGTEEYNLALGQRRAEAARSYLAALGVNPAQVETVSYGSNRPVNPSHTEEAWSQNRRDELRASK